jgi:hypothetical protein
MKKHANEFTRQGVRNLNQGKTIFRPNHPDDCTLGLHHWGEWQSGYPMPDYRACEDCGERQYFEDSK